MATLKQKADEKVAELRGKSDELKAQIDKREAEAEETRQQLATFEEIDELAVQDLTDMENLRRKIARLCREAADLGRVCAGIDTDLKAAQIEQAKADFATARQELAEAEAAFAGVVVKTRKELALGLDLLEYQSRRVYRAGVDAKIPGYSDIGGYSYAESRWTKGYVNGVDAFTHVAEVAAKQVKRAEDAKRFEAEVESARARAAQFHAPNPKLEVPPEVLAEREKKRAADKDPLAKVEG